MRVKRCTPILLVDRIEPCLEFWARLGFVKTNEVPGGDGLVFASLEKDGVELMYQTTASVLAEMPQMAAEITGRNVSLFIEVDDLDAAERATAGAPGVKARHQTFYGSTEFYVREPGGVMVGFAQFPPTAG